MTHVYLPFTSKVMRSDFDLANGDIEVLLVMASTTADTESDMCFISDITTLDEFDGANYVRKTLASKTVTSDTGVASDLGRFDAADVVWTALGAGTRDLTGAIVYKHVAGADSDATSPLITYYDDTLPVTAGGGDVTIEWNASGLLLIKKPT